MNLIIVDSPIKAAKIAPWLDASWRVEASRGRLRDLPTDALGIAVKDAFTPQYRVLANQRGTLTRLKKAAAEAEMIYFATNPDADGETTAWHMSELLKADLKQKAVYRVKFHALTKTSVLASLDAPRAIDTRLVEAHETRHTLDRLVGYLVSALASKRLGEPYPIGRLAGVCLRLMVERERAIETFQSNSLRTCEAKFTVGDQTFTALLSARRDDTSWDEAAVTALVRTQADTRFEVQNIQTKTVSQAPLAPFNLSTLQQAASESLRLTPETTVALARGLYECGFITYPLTNSVIVAADAQAAVREYISAQYGAEYAPLLPNIFDTERAVSYPDAEAIRPTDIARLPETLANGIGADLYALIWRRFVESQMSAAQYREMQVTVQGGDARYTAQSRTLTFEGFLKLSSLHALAEPALPMVTPGQTLICVSLQPISHHTQSPSRYTDATLVADLAEHGIDPLTVSPIRFLTEKGYVKRDGKFLMPTARGVTLVHFLNKHFSEVFDVEQAAQLDRQFDRIAAGEMRRLAVLSAFWEGGFMAQCRALAIQLLPRTLNVVGICPKYGGRLVERRSKRGVFAGCEHYPKCKGRAEPVVLTAVQGTN